MQRFHGSVLYFTQRVENLISKKIVECLFSRINVTVSETIFQLLRIIFTNMFYLSFWFLSGFVFEYDDLDRLPSKDFISLLRYSLLPYIFCLTGYLFFLINLLHEEEEIGV
jgi:hypothetical protein